MNVAHSTIQVYLEAPVATITLNRPEVHNALNAAMISEITEAFGALVQRDDIRAVVLRGEGKSFCAGADLAYMQQTIDHSFDQNLADAKDVQRMYASIHECPKVTIARVHGAAIGGGMGLVAVCDLAISVPEAMFGLSEVRLGIVPAVIGPYVLEKIGMGPTRSLTLTGRRITATDALRINLLTEVVTAEDFDAAVNRAIGAVLQVGPTAVAEAKQLLRKIARLTPQEAASITAEAIARLRVSPEGQEGLRAFLEKRKPAFAQSRGPAGSE